MVSGSTCCTLISTRRSSTVHSAGSWAGRSPVLFTEHGRHHPDHPSVKRKLANRLLLRRHDRVVAVGEAVRQALIHNEGIAPGRVDVIYNGIPLERFDLRLTTSQRMAIRTEIGLETDDLMLIQVARLDYLKDHATAIRTVERLVPRKGNARLVLVGEGPERATIENLVRDRGLEGHVKFLGLRTDVPRLLAAADIALLTSISEGIPLTLIEAMAAGLPVVATRVGGVPEVVVDGETGLLAPAGDDRALAELVFRLVATPDLLEDLGVKGRDLRGLAISPRSRCTPLIVACMRKCSMADHDRRVFPHCSSSPMTGVGTLRAASTWSAIYWTGTRSFGSTRSGPANPGSTSRRYRAGWRRLLSGPSRRGRRNVREPVKAGIPISECSTRRCGPRSDPDWSGGSTGACSEGKSLLS